MAAAKLGLVVDCADPDKLAEFWSAAIGYTPLGGVGSYVLLIDESGQQPKLLLQRVEEPKVGKNRMHFDIETPAVDEEVARLEVLGAVRMEAGAIEEHGNRWVVMADPEATSSASATPATPTSERSRAATSSGAAWRFIAS